VYIVYGLDACPVNVADKRSLDFMQKRLHACCVMFTIIGMCPVSNCASYRQTFLTKFMDNRLAKPETAPHLWRSLWLNYRRELNDLIWLYLFGFSFLFVCCLFVLFVALFSSAVTE